MAADSVKVCAATLNTVVRRSTRRVLSTTALTTATLSNAAQLGEIIALAKYGINAKEPVAELGTIRDSVSATIARNARSARARIESALTAGAA